MNPEPQVAASFLKLYYERFLTEPQLLEGMYTMNAHVSHSDVPPHAVAGLSPVSFGTSGQAKGLDEIRAMLKKLSGSRTQSPNMKVCFAHVDAVPGVAQSLTLLAGGYFLHPDGASRFVHTFVLQSTQMRNNYNIVNDVLRVYPKQTRADGDVEKTPNRTHPARSAVTPSQAGNREPVPAAQDAAHASAQKGADSQRANKPATAHQAHAHGQAPHAAKETAHAHSDASARTQPASHDQAGVAPKSTNNASAATNGKPKSTPVGQTRDWSDLMDEADEAAALLAQKESAAPAGAEKAAPSVSSYAAAVRKAASVNGSDAKPTQKVGGATAAPTQGDDSEARPAGRGNARGGRGAAGSTDDTDGAKRGGFGNRGGFAGGAHGTEGGKPPGEGKSTFIKYCAILKNLPLECSDEEIIGLLAPHVKVTSVRNGTTQNRTYAFVKFDDEHLIESIQESGLTLRGSKVDIEKVVERYTQRRGNAPGSNGNDATHPYRRNTREGDAGNSIFNNRRPHMRGGAKNDEQAAQH